MAKVPDLRRITTEDFPEEVRPSIEKLGTVLNKYMQETNNALNSNLDIVNLNRDIKNFNVIVDADGIPTADVIIKHKVKNFKGMNVILVQNLGSTAFLTGGPFIEFITQNGLIKITHITGLIANTEYNIQIEIIG